jgi:hypothetical protein
VASFEERPSSNINIGALGVPLDTGLRRYDVLLCLRLGRKYKRVGEKFFVGQAAQRCEIAVRRFHHHGCATNIDLMTRKIGVVFQHRLMHETNAPGP